MERVRCFLVCSVLFFLIPSCTQDESTDSSSTLAGSYSTMLVIKDKLYLVNATTIKTFDITDPAIPKLIKESNLGFDIESLFSYDGLLLVGSKRGMYILELDDRGIPKQKSFTNYNNIEICSRDPIVARENLAYVTLSSEDFEDCERFALDELRVFNITDPAKPVLLETIKMAKPKGLGLGRATLYICDETDGLVLFDITNPEKPEKTRALGGFKAFDVIVKNNLLLVTCEDQLRQYDITNEDDIRLVSVINL